MTPDQNFGKTPARSVEFFLGFSFKKWLFLDENGSNLGGKVIFMMSKLFCIQ